MKHPWEQYGFQIDLTAAKDSILDNLAREQKEALRRLSANIDATLQGNDMPYPPAKETCPHCGKEIDR